MRKCGKLGHYATCCRLARKITHIAVEEAYSADEDSTPSRILLCQEKINAMGTKSKNEPPLYTKTVFVHTRPIKFIVDAGSPVPLLPRTKLNSIPIIRPVREDYRDVIDNKRKFEGKTTANVEVDGKKKQPELLITNN